MLYAPKSPAEQSSGVVDGVSLVDRAVAFVSVCSGCSVSAPYLAGGTGADERDQVRAVEVAPVLLCGFQQKTMASSAARLPGPFTWVRGRGEGRLDRGRRLPDAPSA